MSLGSLQLNSLRNVKKVPYVPPDEYQPDESNGAGEATDGTSDFSEGVETKRVNGRRIRMLRRLPKSIAAFEIDASSSHSRVAFLYGVSGLGGTETNIRGKSARHASDPQVWFQESSGRWFFISSSFMDYFRLMVTHLGLPGWQYLYTDVGLDPVARQWFNYLLSTETTTKIDIDRNRGEAASAYSKGKYSESIQTHMESSTSGKKGSTVRNQQGMEGASLFGIRTAERTPAGLITLRDCSGSDALYGEGTMGSYRSHVDGSHLGDSATLSNGVQTTHANSWLDRPNLHSSVANIRSSNRSRGSRPLSAPMRRRNSRRR